MKICMLLFYNLFKYNTNNIFKLIFFVESNAVVKYSLILTRSKS